jgi:hypothetical protein
MLIGLCLPYLKQTEKIVDNAKGKVTSVHAMDTQVRWSVQLHTFWNSELDGNER